MSERVVWRVLDDEAAFGGDGLSTTRNGYEETVGWWEDGERNGVVVDPSALQELVAQAGTPEMAGHIVGLEAQVKSLEGSATDMAEEIERLKDLLMEAVSKKDDALHAFEVKAEYCDRMEAQLGACYRIAGADTDGDEDERHAEYAVDAVKELRIDYDDACEEAHQAEAQCDELLAAMENLENDDGKIPAHAWDLLQAAITKATP